MALTKVTYSMIEGPISNLADFATLKDALATGNTVLIPASTTTISVASGDVVSVLGGLRRISCDHDLVINLAAGNYTSTTIYSGCPTGKNVTIRGATPDSKTISAVPSSSGSAGAWSVVFTVNDATGISINDFVFIKSIVGTGREKVLEGCWKVLGVSGNNVTCLVKAQNSSLPTLSVSSGTMLVAKTVVNVNGAIGIDIAGDGNIFQNMVLAGDGTGADAAGVRIQNGWGGFARSTAYPFGVVNFAEHGFYALLGSTISCFDAYSSGNGQNGLYVLQTSEAQATRLICTGNGTSGAVASVAGDIAASSGNFSGNGQYGVFIAQSSGFTCASGYIYENASVGVNSTYRGVATLTGSKIAGNASYGVDAQQQSYVYTVSVDYTGGNSAANEFSTGNSIIQTTSTNQTYYSVATKHYTVSLVIATDAVGTIDFGSTSVVRSVAFNIFQTASIYGAVRCKTVSSIGTVSLYGTGFAVNNYGTNPTGVLTGTTGAGGAFTLSAANDGKFYIENRTGVTYTVTLDVMGV